MSDDFHDLFKQSVPEAPSPQGWAQGALQKRRNRQRTVGGVAAVAIVGLAVPLALGWPGRDEPIVAAPAPAPNELTTQDAPPSIDIALDPAPEGRVGAAACWDEEGEPVMEAHNAGAIPTGAARAWLCTNPQHYGTGGPLEPLVTDVDGLIEAFYAQPELTDDSAQEAAEHYTVVFEFDDGRRLSFTGDAQDGTVLTDGEVRLQGSDAFFEDEVAARWAQQRERVGAPAGGYVPSQECPVASYQQSLLPVSLGEVTGGYGCAADADTARATELTPSLAAEVGRAAQAEGVPVEASQEGGSATVVLTNAWGDQIHLRQAGERYEFRGEDSLMGWTPAPELAEELDGLLQG